MEGKGIDLPFNVSNLNKTYVCVKFLGKGKFGKVFECHMEGSTEKLAIKQLDILSNNFQTVQREKDILNQLNYCNHVVRIVDDFTQGRYNYIVTEFMGGGNLQEYLKINKNLQMPVIVKFFRQIVLGLKEIHQNKIAHRDLKPANIMLQEQSPEAVIKIVDFGLSNWVSKIGSKVGSPIYSAPEVLKKYKYDQTCDI